MGTEAGSPGSWEASDARDRQFKDGQGVERHGGNTTMNRVQFSSVLVYISMADG